MKKIAELKINSNGDREHIVVALVNSGYRVQVEERKRPNEIYELDYWVVIYEEK